MTQHPQPIATPVDPADAIEWDLPVVYLPLPPTPLEQALTILGPHLAEITLYRPTA